MATTVTLDKNVKCRGRDAEYTYRCVVTENSYDIVNNTSNVTITFSIKGPWSASFNSWKTYYAITIDGTRMTEKTSSPTIGNTFVSLLSYTGNIKHNDDGTGRINVGVILYQTDSSLADYLPTQYTADNRLEMGSVTLTTIPRASSVSLSTTSVNVESSITANITRASSNFTHTVEFYINNSYRQEYTNVGTSQAFKIPATWYAAMPSTTSTTAYCRVTTYNGSTQIGSPVTQSFTITIPSSVKPSVGTITVTPQTYNYLLQNKNKVTISVSGCSAGTGSSIKSYTFSGPGLTTIATTSTSVTTNTISNTGTFQYTVTVTDTRGRTISKPSGDITCYAYNNPSFSTFSAYRYNTSSQKADTNAASVKCDFSLAYSSINSSNHVTVKVFYKQSTSSWSSVSVLTDSKNTSGSVTLNNIDPASTYSVYATISDRYGGSEPSGTVTIFSESRILNISANGTGIALGKMAESDNLFECRWPAQFNDEITAKSNVTSDGVGTFSSVHGLEEIVTNGNLRVMGDADCAGTMTSEAIVGSTAAFDSGVSPAIDKHADIPLRIGNPDSFHLDFGRNTILAKSNATTSAALAVKGTGLYTYINNATDPIFKIDDKAFEVNIKNNNADTSAFNIGKDDLGAYVQAKPTYNRTHGNSPNLCITDQGTLARTSSSSKRYKTDISDVTDESLDPYNILNIPVRQFKYNKDNIPMNRQPDDLYIGFIAEEVEEAYPAAAEYTSDGQVEMWNIKVLVPAMLKILQDQQKEITELKETIKTIKG